MLMYAVEAWADDSVFWVLVESVFNCDKFMSILNCVLICLYSFKYGIKKYNNYVFLIFISLRNP